MSASARAICDVLGVEGFEPEDDLGPFLPPVCQVNVDPRVMHVGDVVTVRVRVQIRQIIPVPLPWSS